MALVEGGPPETYAFEGNWLSGISEEKLEQQGDSSPRVSKTAIR